MRYLNRMQKSSKNNVSTDNKEISPKESGVAHFILRNSLWSIDKPKKNIFKKVLDSIFRIG